MAAEELDDEERALLEKHRASKKRSKEDEREVWIRSGDTEAAIPYHKAKAWLQKTFGIDLDDEPEQEQPDAAPGRSESGGEGGEVRRFGGRRMA
jgi:hypothetical protein